MKRWWGVGVVALGAGLVCAGCSSSKDDGRTVAGRTGSAAPTIRADFDAAAVTSLRLATTTDGGATTARAEATLFDADALGAALRFPGGEAEERLVRDAADGSRFALAVDGTPEALADRFPAGTYAFVVEAADGSQPAMTVVLEDAPWPAAPAVVAPADGATGIAPGATVSWTWQGSAGAFDVTVVDDATGAVAFEARDVLGTTVTLPPGALAPGHRWRLVLAASTSPSTALARREARAVTRFETAP